MPGFDWHVIERSMLGPPEECGDTGIVQVNGTRCFAALVDVLGHGKAAHDVAVAAREYLRRDHWSAALVDVMMGLHDHLRSSRGAVASLCRLDISDGLLEFVGVGNVAMRVLGTSQFRLLPQGGVVGYTMGTPRRETAQVVEGDVLFLHSDGVRENADWQGCAGLLLGNAGEIAMRVLDRFGKRDDDASCVVVRCVR